MIRLMTPCIVLLLGATLSAWAQQTQPGATDGESAQTQPASTQPATQPADKESAKPDPLHPRVKIVTTLGEIVLELDAVKAPVSVINFIGYAESGYYEGTIFHRVMDGFMIQGGGMTIEMDNKEEGLQPPINNEWENGLKNKKGTIAMARLGNQPDSATAQFFINVVDNAILDQPSDGAGYAVFGHVIEGADTVEKIRTTDVIRHPKYPGGVVTPKEPVVIQAVKVIGAFDRAAVEAKFKEANQEALKALAEGQVLEEQNRIDLIAKIEAETGKKFIETKSGLKYLILEAGKGSSPQPNDAVKVDFEISAIDGKVLNSTYQRGQPLEIPFDGLPQGWKEGLLLTKVGGKTKLIIPPSLWPNPNGSWLRIDMELHAVTTKAQQVEAREETMPTEAIKQIEKETGKKVQTTDSGLMYVMIVEGDGANPGPTDTVEVHYEGTLVNGEKFDSSYDRNAPSAFPLNGVIGGWTEGIALMKVGSTAKLIIPPELAYGPGGKGSIPPNAWLIFKVELLGIQ
jgi:FKBP-type peptidyl-prolyl cis-trans isomerase/cyclophilin family peptidyl-prolyl cis-trans isomerase